MNANAVRKDIDAFKTKKGINIPFNTKNALKTILKGVLYGV